MHLQRTHVVESCAEDEELLDDGAATERTGSLTQADDHDSVSEKDL